MRFRASLLIVLMLAPAFAGACERSTLDETAVQWSSVIVLGKLVEISDRVQMKAISVKPPKGVKAADITAVYWFRLYSFEIEKVIEGGGLKPKFRIEVIRFFGMVDDPTHTVHTPVPVAGDGCAALNRNSIDKRFVLLLRPEQEFKFKAPVVWNDAKNPDPRDAEVHGQKGFVVIHLVGPDEVTDARVNELKTLVASTRATERKVSDGDIRKLVDQIVDSYTEEEAEPACAALRKIGFKAVGAIKSARDKKETAPIPKERLAALALELSPPPLEVTFGEHREEKKD